jgi:hypothetical protein
VDIPYDRLGVPREHRDKVGPDAPRKARLAVAKGLLPIPPDVLVPMLYVLTADDYAPVSEAAHATLVGMPEQTVAGALSRRTHPKVLEYLAEHRRHDWELMIKVYTTAGGNDRTARIIVQGARDDQLLDVIVSNQERLLISPVVFLDIQDNKHFSLALIDRARNFLRMQRQLPAGWRTEEQHVAWLAGDTVEPERTPVEEKVTIKVKGAKATRKKVHVTELSTMNAEAECMAAILGLRSPWTNQDVAERLDVEVWEAGQEGLAARFAFGFEDDMDFGQEMVQEDADLDQDEVRNMTKIIADMAVGKKIKLAYMGNAECRKILLRDRNKTVATAVVKSGRMTDSEAAFAAANKNLHMDVLREISGNREFLRKYTVKVALVNNPKCPVNVAISLVSGLSRSDLATLSRNKNVPGVVSKLAKRMIKNRNADG